MPHRRSYAPLTLQLSPRWVLGAHTYLWATVLASVQARPGTYQELNLLGELLAYQRLGECHWLALRLRAEAITRPESRTQFLLGADSGLRGVLPRRFAGQRRLIGNLELRPTLHRRVSWVLAGALFADAGAACIDRWALGVRLRDRVEETQVLCVCSRRPTNGAGQCPCFAHV
jgi:hypothetical protein